MTRAMVVDDSRAMRLVLSRILHAIGITVVGESSNGLEAINHLAGASGVDLVLVDWNMPVMDGLEFIRRVRANPQFGGVRVLMVTTEVERENVATALAAGADEYVMKPFTSDVIVEKLRLLGFGAAACTAES
jgi:two-component system chemotaxis response regulator CheY